MALRRANQINYPPHWQLWIYPPVAKMEKIRKPSRTRSSDQICNNSVWNESSSSTLRHPPTSIDIILPTSNTISRTINSRANPRTKPIQAKSISFSHTNLLNWTTICSGLKSMREYLPFHPNPFQPIPPPPLPELNTPHDRNPPPPPSSFVMKQFPKHESLDPVSKKSLQIEKGFGDF